MEPTVLDTTPEASAIQRKIWQADETDMLSGSMVSRLFGEPRANQDIDIVIAPTFTS